MISVDFFAFFVKRRDVQSATGAKDTMPKTMLPLVEMQTMCERLRLFVIAKEPVAAIPRHEMCSNEFGCQEIIETEIRIVLGAIDPKVLPIAPIYILIFEPKITSKEGNAWRLQMCWLLSNIEDTDETMALKAEIHYDRSSANPTTTIDSMCVKSGGSAIHARRGPSSAEQKCCRWKR